MRWRLAGAAGVRALAAVRAVDTATSPTMQRRGIFSRLDARGARRVRGRGRLDGVQHTERPEPAGLPEDGLAGGRRVAAVGARAPSGPARGRRAPPRPAVRAGRGGARGLSLVPAEEALSAERAPRSIEPEVLHTARSLEYLRWRYAEGPLAYHVLSGGGATVIARLRSRGPLREAVVCEALAPEGAQDDLRELLRVLPREAGADHAVAHLGTGWPGRAELAARGLPAPAPRRPDVHGASGVPERTRPAARGLVVAGARRPGGLLTPPSAAAAHVVGRRACRLGPGSPRRMGGWPR